MLVACTETTRPELAITPASAAVTYGATQQFTTSVSESKSTQVLYSVQEGAAGGTVSSEGLYTAPSVPGTFHVVATLASDSSAHVQAEVTVSGPAFAVAPLQTTLAPGAHAKFAAFVGGTADSDVTWSLQEGAAAGTIESSGGYTAPATEGTFHVVAQSTTVANTSATASIVVSASAPTIVIFVEPPVATVTLGQLLHFSASLSGTPNQVVTWSVLETGGGAINTSGTYTAPAQTGTFHVQATSTDDPRVFEAVAVSVVNAITVSVSPTTLSLAAGDSANVSATVSGSSAGVAWSVAEDALGGTVTVTGGQAKYSSSPTAGVYHVVATAVEDSRQTAVITVTATAPAFPTAGLVAHYKSDAVNGGGVPLPADGAALSTWKDISGNGYDLAQDAGTRRPVFNLNQVQSHPSVSFDGVDDFLVGPLFGALIPQPTFSILVYRLPTNPSTSCTLLDSPWEGLYPDGGAVDDRNRISLLSGPPGAMQLYAGSFTSPHSGTVPPAVFHYLYAKFAGSSSVQYLDGAVLPFGSANQNPGAERMAGVQLGARNDASRTDLPVDTAVGTYCKADVAEVVIYSRALTDDEVTQVSNFIRLRYGL